LTAPNVGFTFSAHLLAWAFRFLDCSNLEQHPCMGFLFFVTNSWMCALLKCIMKLDCTFRLMGYCLVLIWWPMINGIVFESRKSIHFNHYCISFNLLLAFESANPSPFLFCWIAFGNLWMKGLVIRRWPWVNSWVLYLYVLFSWPNFCF